MNLKWNGIERRQTLRTEAEKMASRLYPEHLATQTAEKLLHELLVHKIELELQNEELRLAYISVQEKQERYIDLYDFAPVGFMTINQEGFISEINLTGSELFGIERVNLLGQRLSNLIVPEDQDHWHFMFIKMMALSKGEKLAFCLTFEGKETLFSAYLDCQRWENLAAEAGWRFALIELSRLQRAINQYTLKAANLL